MGSSSDARIMVEAAKILDMFKVTHDDRIVSAHRTPTRIAEYANFAEKNGIKVIIAGAGGAAHLPGMVSSYTILPVVGVPILVYNDKDIKKNHHFKFSSFGGLDSLLSISEMPTGSPIACVGINKAANAALFALKVLAIEYPEIQKKLSKFKKQQFSAVVKESKQLQKKGLVKFIEKLGK